MKREEIIELAIETPGGIADCRIELQDYEGELAYCATILYPDMANGYSRSTIYSHFLEYDGETGSYSFSETENPVHPRIKALEPKVSAAIIQANGAK